MSKLKPFLEDLFLKDQGYHFLVPILILWEVVVSALIIKKIPFTEIDFQTYLGQAFLFLQGETDYSKLNPAGGSGPCVYPAVHLYLYSFFHKITNGGKHLLPAQACFAFLLITTLVFVSKLYRVCGAPPILLVPLVLSKRLHSIFLLRLFNDPVAILLVYVSLYLASRNQCKASAAVYSLGLGIKMNVLLFLPGLALSTFRSKSFRSTLHYIVLIVALQVVFSLPFTTRYPSQYVSFAFDFSRQFLYKWTVNWRFVSETVFLSRQFSLLLVSLHLNLLLIFSLFKWTRLWSDGISWLARTWSSPTQTPSSTFAKDMVLTSFTSNVIGVVCSRSLHYQFYSWYFHQLPLLLYFSKIPLALQFAILAGVEWAWNVFPSTKASSQLLLGIHLLVVVGCWTLPNISLSQDDQDLHQNLKEAQQVEDLVGGDQVIASDGTPNVPQPPVVAQRLDDQVAKTFQRRIATRRRIVGVLSKQMPLLRILLILASLILVLLLPHPYSAVSKGTYVDENALQPGQAKVYWDYFDVTFADMLSEKIEYEAKLGTTESRAEFVYSELMSYGLDVHKQRYNFTNLNLVAPNSPTSGVNVYARSASPRIDGREAIVLTASWHSLWTGENDPFSPQEQGKNKQRRINVRGIASLFTLARYLMTQNHLSKDLIFVISDGYLEGIQAWTSAYFDNVPSNLKAEPIRGGGSQIWNALSIDYPADSFSAVAIMYEGLDGQLPNMDSFNALLRIIERVTGGIPVILKGQVDPEAKYNKLRSLIASLGLSFFFSAEELDKYERGLNNIAHQFWYGASGQPSGAHALFQRYHIDAISVFAIPAKGPYGFFHIGRIVESYVRSLSNLLERLHHSQFLYLLVSPRRFVPIGILVFVPLLLSLSMTCSGLGLWFREEKTSHKNRERLLTEYKVNQQVQGDVRLETLPLSAYRNLLASSWLEESLNNPNKFDQISNLLFSSSRPYQSAALGILISQLVGGSILYLFSKLPCNLDDKRSGSLQVYLSMAITSAVPLLIFPVLRLLTESTNGRIGGVLRAFSYLQSGMIVAVMSVLNFSLATLLGLALIVSLHFGTPTRRSFFSLLQYALIQLLSPTTLLLLLSHHTFVSHALYDWHILGVKTIPLICLLYQPILTQIQISLLAYTL